MDYKATRTNRKRIGPVMSFRIRSPTHSIASSGYLRRGISPPRRVPTRLAVIGSTIVPVDRVSIQVCVDAIDGEEPHIVTSIVKAYSIRSTWSTRDRTLVLRLENGCVLWVPDGVSPILYGQPIGGKDFATEVGKHVDADTILINGVKRTRAQVWNEIVQGVNHQ